MIMKKSQKLVILVSIFMISILSFIPSWHYITPLFARAKVSPEGPAINDTHLTTQLIASGLKAPSAMTFIGQDDILVTEKNTGNVVRIVNGVISQQPLLHVEVAKKDERGLLGIAISRNTETGKRYVFLYYTEAQRNDVQGVTPDPLGNRVYRYELVNDKLVNPKLLLDLPALPGPRHNAGKMAIGPDNNLYVSIGDVDASFLDIDTETKAQNNEDGPAPDGRAGILRITEDGKPVGNGILGNTPILNLYYAYGIKNSFGFDFDPVTGKMWDTENGPTFGDEINLVEPGFNSGWLKVQGIWKTDIDPAEKLERGEIATNESLDLVDFGGKGKYSPPEFTWSNTVAPTALRFFSSDKFGEKYNNNIFVGDIKYGNIYHFKLNKDRTGFIVNGSLADKVASGEDGTEQIEFAHGFGGIADLELGPDGYLYVLVFDNENGSIFKISPVSSS
ncbi:MAG: PQQ-dependent sugar dehydrogenase [Thermoproteota archaeon]|nr:PQQ-dependent sugar dehydrogenase [Thermoproteota archaeon]